MKASHYISIGIRFFSVFMFLQTFREAIKLPELFLNGTIGGMQASVSFVLASVFITFLVAMLLWIFPSIISNFIIRKEMDKQVTPMNPLEFATVVISGIGLFLLYYAISDSIYWMTVVNLGEQNTFGNIPFTLDNYSKAAVITTGTELLFSSVLIYKSKSISKLILRVVR